MRKECFHESKGVLYTASTVDVNDKKIDSADEIVFSLKRKVNSDDDGNNGDKDEGFSGRQYALISECMWFKALKW